eukprot:403334234
MGCCCLKDTRNLNINTQDELILEKATTHSDKQQQQYSEQQKKRENASIKKQIPDEKVKKIESQVKVKEYSCDIDEDVDHSILVKQEHKPQTHNVSLVQQQVSPIKQEFMRYQIGEYQNENEVTNVEGLQQFITDLDLNIETAESLLGFYILKFSSFSKIVFSDFERIMKERNTSKVTDLKFWLKNEVQIYMLNLQKYKEFQKQSFYMAKNDHFHTYLLIDDSIDILEAVLRFNPTLVGYRTTEILLKFIRDQMANGNLKAFKKDEWNSIIDFLQAHPNSIKHYDENESWPTLFDNFVQWGREQSLEEIKAIL